MITISLCMIVRDEEEVLDRGLNSVKDLVDEIVIVDTGSVDKTKENPSAYTGSSSITAVNCIIIRGTPMRWKYFRPFSMKVAAG